MRSKIFIGALIAIVIVGIVFLARKGNTTDQKNVYAVLPLTGQSAEMGKTAMATIDMFMREHTSCSFKLSVFDSESNPSKAISVIRQAIAAKGTPEAIMVFPAYISSAVIPTITEQETFVLAPTSRIPDNSKTREQTNYQTINPLVPDIIEPLVKYSAGKFDKIAILYCNEEYGLANEEYFRESIKKHNPKTIILERSYSIVEDSARDIVSKIVSWHPDAILVSGTPTRTFINMFREIANVGYDGAVLSDPAFSCPFVLSALGNAAEGVIFTCTSADFSDGKVNNGHVFREHCIQNNIVPFYVPVQIYDTMNIIDSFCRNNVAFNRDSLIKSDYKGCADPIKFLDTGDCSYPYYLATVKQLKVVQVK